MTPTRLRTTLQRLGLSQVRAADLLGVSDRQMRRWIAGTAEAPLWLRYALKGLQAEIPRTKTQSHPNPVLPSAPGPEK